MADPDRQQRLAEKLRENLRRRKAQGKARARPRPDEEEKGPAGPAPGDGKPGEDGEG